MYELYKNTWIDVGQIAAVTVSEKKEEGVSLFLRRKKEKVVGYRFNIVLSAIPVGYSVDVDTEEERDEVLKTLTGVSNGK
ncbi:MAG: hypothetical protein V3S69_03445 [Dehalococcoidales bacterium]